MSIKALKRKWKTRLSGVEKAVNDRNDMERGLLLAVCLVILLLLWDSLLFGPISAERKKIRAQIRTAQADKVSLSRELESVTAAIENDPLDALKQERNQLRIDIAELNDEMQEILSDLVSLEEMREVVISVLEKSPEIEVLQVESVDGIELSDVYESTKATDYAMSLFKHGMAIQLEGEYFSTLTFLKKMENIEHKLLWDTIEYTVTDYPKAHINIVVRTIGDSEGWIGV